MKDKFPKFKNTLLHDIESGVVAIEPRWKAILPKILVGALIALAFISTVLIFAYILFAVRVAGHSILLGFGPRGWSFFLAFFPWHILALDVLLVVSIAVLAKRFAFGWKTPRLYLLLGLLVAAFISGALVDKPFNDAMSRHKEYLPKPVGGLYKAPSENKGLVRGTVLLIGDNHFVLLDERTEEEVWVKIHSERAKRTLENLVVGAGVVVAGDEVEGGIEAFGVRLMPVH